MAKKPNKRLAHQIKAEDVILLERPEVKILDVSKATKKYRHAPKDSLIVTIEDKATGKVDEIFLLSDDKVDLVKRPSIFERFSKWLNKNHEKHQKKVAKTTAKHKEGLIPPLFQ